MKSSKKTFELALICGGPSLERGISMNSARSVMDHLQSEAIRIHPFYVDHELNFYAISCAQLYSNTPSDFDFKLAHTATRLTEDTFIQQLKALDLVFPAIHGSFGEDGVLQRLLERHHLPFVGSGSEACAAMFHKHRAATTLADNGFATLDSLLLHTEDPNFDIAIKTFFARHHLQRVIIKPVAGGSSIGVFSANTVEQACAKAQQLFAMKISEEALVEPFCEGREFTVIVLQNEAQQAVALIPTQIQVNYEQGGVFDYRRKYLPTSNTRWFCPPQFSDDNIIKIQNQAEQLFHLFKMRDCARLDGWLMDDGRILFTDFNPLSGMEQNSFMFQQASRIGLSHAALLDTIVKNACQREGITLPRKNPPITELRKPVYVLFGGRTAERQVSLMSGTNVWLKLRNSKQYQPQPYFLDPKGQIWQLPYTHALNHTVEETYENCLTASSVTQRINQYARTIRQRLFAEINTEPMNTPIPRELSRTQFLQEATQAQAIVFLALHGGEGENGYWQQLLKEQYIPYNGSGPKVSALCMDKYLTGLAVSNLGQTDLITAPKKSFSGNEPARLNAYTDPEQWQALCDEWHVDSLIIKPQREGCSAGIARLHSADDLKNYMQAVYQKEAYIPANTLSRQPQMIEMPQHENIDYLLEAYIKTDEIRIQKNELQYRELTGWLELTVGVLEKDQQYHALNPSITVAEHDVLSLEEKFQGGTGVNITPPPKHIITQEMLGVLKTAVERLAAALGLQNYARLDVFFNTKTGQTLLIEVNSLPALTPATVIYHQALAETPSMTPTQFLERLLALATELDRSL